MEGRDRDMGQILIAFCDMVANQHAKLFHRDAQFLSCLRFGVLNLVLFEWDRACIHNPKCILKRAFAQPQSGGEPIWILSIPDRLSY
jgi:hypothetical protein